MGVNNKPAFNDAAPWPYDYVLMAIDGSFYETFTYYVNGTYNLTTHAYTGGTIVGYKYVQWDDALRSNALTIYYSKV